LKSAAAGTLVASSLRTGLAQNYPQRPVVLVCPFAPGGSADIMARLMAQKLGDGLKQSVVVENKPGAGGLVGAGLVAKARPDGHTLLLVTGAYPSGAALSSQPGFDASKDIAMVSMITSYPFVLITAANAPFQSLGDFLTQARAKPGALNYSSSGVGSIGHLSGELMCAMGNLELTHIPTRGGSSALNELLSGRVQVMFEAPTLALTAIKNGQVKPLAITGLQRYPGLPQIPAVAEVMPGYQVTSFIGLGATAGTSSTIIQVLNDHLRHMLTQSDVVKRLQELGGEPLHMPTEAFRAHMDQELQKWQSLIQTRRIERT
jgi:tripartite-type tricarboxylate transporter receptor subunit TctC